MKNCNDITFLSTYWKEVNNISKKITIELPIMKKNNDVKKISKHLSIIKYSALNNWDISGLITGKNYTLIALADKIRHMILKGDSINIKPMLLRIINKGIHKLSQHNKNDNNMFLGYGHFRWNYQLYILNDVEIKQIKTYFNM